MIILHTYISSSVKKIDDTDNCQLDKVRFNFFIMRKLNVKKFHFKVTLKEEKL